MIKKTRGQRIDTVFALLIFCVFAVSVLMVLMLSAGTYKNITEITRDGYDERTALSYIRTKAKSYDTAGGISIGSFNGIPALCFDEEIDSTIYRAMIYYYDGWVYELFSEAGLDFEHEDGVKIIKVPNLAFEEIGNRLIKVGSGAGELLIYPRGGNFTTLTGSPDGDGGLAG